MVSFISVICILIELLTLIIVPISIALFYCLFNRRKGVWKAWLLGMAGFLVFHIMIRVPIMGVITNSAGFLVFERDHYILSCIVLAAVKAFVTVFVCFLAAKLLQKRLNRQQGIAAGLGYGTVNAMVLMGVPCVFDLIVAILVRMNLWASFVFKLATWIYRIWSDSILVYALADEILVSIKTEPAYAYLLDGYGSMLSMIMYIAVSLIVCYFVYKKKSIIGVLIAFVASFLAELLKGKMISYVTIIMAAGTKGAAYMVKYSLLTVITVVAIVFIILICKKWKTEEKIENNKMAE